MFPADLALLALPLSGHSEQAAVAIEDLVLRAA